MSDVADAAWPLLHHYFSNKRDPYLATVESAATELSQATRPDPALPLGERAALDANLEWIEHHERAYRAGIQGGTSSDLDVQAIVERSRYEVVDRVAAGVGWTTLTPTQRLALTGWVGFLEHASLEWLTSCTVTKTDLIQLLTASIDALVTPTERPPRER